MGEYDQHFQEILQPESGCRSFSPDVIFLSLSMKVLAPNIHHDFLGLTTEQREAELDRILQLVSDWAGLARQQTDAVLLISDFSRPVHSQAGLADAKLVMGEAEFYHQLNLQLQKMYLEDPQVHIFNMDHTLSCAGKVEAQDAKMYYLAKMEWTEKAQSAIADQISRHIYTVLGRTKKCLVLDLDNTLWGGVVGEDGVDGLSIGEGSAHGEAFSDFQHYIKALKERGIVLAICSKNNVQDAEEVFQSREEMVLRLDDFSATRINWQQKHLNIQEIAKELNIGTDSMVFVDDNPVECELVRQMMPEVFTVELSGDPSLFAAQLKQADVFEKHMLTAEDREKSAQYAQNAKRASLKQNISDMESFYKSLGTEIVIEQAKDKHKARVHQLFTKTNQFNLTTIRYSLADVEKFIEDAAWDLHITHVKDNFGDLGIVGLYLINKDERAAKIDSFILSCRAMGRGIETAMMNKIKQDYLVDDHVELMTAHFMPTVKNKPVTEFYDAEGFAIDESEPASEPQDGKKYILNRELVQLRECAGITIRGN
jgi:FkbH-like protein